MKATTRNLVLVAALGLVAGAAWAEGGAIAPAQILAGDLKWVTLPSGLQRADIAGDDKKAGLYVYRVKFPANYKNAPHYHPDDRVVVVLSGTIYMGYGEKFDEGVAKALPAGSIWTEPMKAPHFNWTKEEVVIQVSGVGPSGSIPVAQK